MVLALLLGVGCKPAPKPEPQAVASAKPSAPLARREGLAAKVIWRRPDADRYRGHASLGSATEKLSVSEVRSDGNRVYFDVTHRGAQPERVHDGAAAVLHLRVGQCEERTVNVAGTVWRDWDTPATVSVSLADLPDGELDLTLRAFAASKTLSLRKTGKELKTLPLQEREGYVYLPPDPAHGRWFPAHGIAYAKACPGEVTP